MERPSPGRAGVWRIVLVYALFAALWIGISDHVLVTLVSDPEMIADLATLKGWFFVLITSGLLYSLLRLDRQRLAQATEARERSRLDLEETLGQLRWLEDSLPGSYVYQYTLETDGTPVFLHLSAGVEEIHQLKVADITRDASMLRRQTHPDYRAAMEEAEARSQRDLVDFNEELFIVRPDGNTRWLQIRSRPHRRADGRVVWDGVATDITDRQRSGLALRESEEQLRSLVTLLPDALFINQGNRVVYANPRALRLMGAERQEQVLGRSPLDFFHEDDRSQVRARIAGLLQDGVQTSRAQLRLQRVDGVITSVETVAALFSFGGKPAIQVVLSDITERLRSEEALRSSEERLRIVTENARAGLVTVSRERRYVYANQAYAEIVGRPLAEVIGHSLTEVLAGLYTESIAPQLDRAFAGERVQTEVVRKTPTGERYFAATFEPLRQGRDVELVVAVIVDITDRREGERILREKEEQLHAADRRLAEIVQGMSEACITLDWDWRFTFVNDRCEVLFRRKRGDVIGRRFWDVFPELVGAPAEQHYRRVMAERVPLAYEAFSPVAECWIETRLFPTPDGIAAFMVDITARHEAGEKLRESEAQLRALGDNLPDSYVVRYTHGPQKRPIYLYLSAGVEQVHGLTAEAIVQDPDLLLDQITAEHRPAVAEAATANLAFMRDTDLEFQFKRADGAIRWLHLRAHPVERPGRPVEWFGVAADCTDRRNAEQARREITAIVESTDDAIIGKDLAGIVTSWNPGAERIFGFTAAEMVGSPIRRVVPADRQAEADRILAAIRQGELVQNFETVRLTKLGRPLDISVTVSPIRDATGRVIGASKVARDITWRKRAESALREQQQQLQLFIEHAPAAIAMFDRDMRYLLASRRWRTDCQISVDDIVGRSHYELFPDLPERWREVHRRCLGGETEQCEEDAMPRPDGTIDWMKWETRPWYTANGEVGGLIIIAEMIGDRKRAAEALRESEEKLRLVTSFARVGLVMVNREHRYIFANSTYVEILDLPSPDIVGRSVAEVLGAVYEEQVRPQLEHAFRGERVAFQLNRPASGKNHHFAVNYEPVRRSGQVEAVVVVITDITEVKLAEDKIRRQEALLQETGRIARVGGWSWEARTGESVWTDEVARIHEVDPAVPINRERGLQFYSEESRPRIAAAMQQALAHGESYDLELEIVTARQARKWVHIIGRAVQENGRVVRLQGSLQDVTEQHRLGEEQERQQRRVSLLADISRRLVLTDSPGEILDQVFADLSRELQVDIFANYMVSPEGDRLLLESSGGLNEQQKRDFAELPFGVSLCGLVAQKKQRMVYADLPAVTEPQAAGIIALGVRAYAGHPLMAGDRLIGTVSFGSRRRTSYNDDDVRLMKAVADQVAAAVERHRLLGALRLGEERFREVVESIQEVFWMTDVAKHRLIYLSPGFPAIWGRSCESVYASLTAWSDSIHPDDQARVLEAARTRQVLGTYHETYRILRPDGATRWVRDRAFPVKDVDGQVRRVVGVAEDITEQRELEAKFLRSQRMEAIGTLAGGVAHDLNNILAPVLMISGLLRERLTTTEDRGFLDMLDGSARRGAGIIRQLLTFSRGSGGEKVIVQLRHLLKEMVALMRETLPRNIDIREQTDPGLWPVSGDPTQLHQVLMNLCVNARDAMSGGGLLSLTAQNILLDEADARSHAGARAGRYTVIAVADTGHGMSPDVQRRIFDPFFTTKAVGKGTGLGLATVLSITKQHGGFVTLESDPGRGTTFKVYLPVAEAGREEGRPASAEAGPSGRGELILLVDDEPTICAAARLLLEKHNYRVVTAGNGREALIKFVECQDEVKLVLTDSMMPIMGGAALAQSLRTIRPQLPIVATTGLDETTQMAEFERLGVVDVLNKPCAPEQMLVVIRRRLDA